MIEKLHLIEIIRSAHKSLYTRTDGRISGKFNKHLIFDMLPLFIAILLAFFGNSVEEIQNFSSNFFTTLSLFAGLLFSLIVVIVDRAKSKKIQVSSQNEEAKNYLKRYLNFSEQLTTQISFAILLSFLLISLMLLAELNINDSIRSILNKVDNLILYLKQGLSVIIFYFSAQFLLVLLVIISSMYSLFAIELDPNHKEPES